MNTPLVSIQPLAADTWRISVAMSAERMIPGFSFNQYLVIDERPLLFHTGPKRLLDLVRRPIETLLPLEDLRYVAFSRVEPDECGVLADFLATARNAQPVCGRAEAMLNISDLVDVPPLAMEDGEVLDLGRHQLVWQSSPHQPYDGDFDCLYDRTTGTLFCGEDNGGAMLRSLATARASWWSARA